MDTQELACVSVKEKAYSGGKMLEEVEKTHESCIGASHENSIVSILNI